MKIDEIRALLEKYQKGHCTADEQKIINEWVNSLQLENEGLGEEEIAGSLDKIRGNLLALTGRPVAHDSPVPRLIHARGWRRPLTWVAAATLTALLAGSAWLLFHRASPAGPVLARVDSNDTTVITGRGETKQLILSDGSTIELNAATVFRYPKKFAHSTRTVSLVKGEAFFQVMGDPARPFNVLTGKWRTTVLGTSFDIRAYGQDASTQIALLTGKVKVSEDMGATGSSSKSNAQSVSLLPRQWIRIDKTSGKIATAPFVEDYEVAAWKEGAMHFKDAGFAELAFGIGNKYNITLVNKSHKQRWSYTGLFRNESLQEVVETICQTEGLGYRFTDEGILIVDKN